MGDVKLEVVEIIREGRSREAEQQIEEHSALVEAQLQLVLDDLPIVAELLAEGPPAAHVDSIDLHGQLDLDVAFDLKRRCDREG